jgi:SAM-dependent methyltransferase
MAEIIRDHDEFYLKEDRKDKPKEYFKFISSVTAPHLDALASPRILDIGCATGDFLYYMAGLYPKANLHGIDVMPQLLQRAASELPHATLSEGNICDAATLPRQQFDAVFMNGVHSIFDDVKPWLENFVQLIDGSANGRGYIFGIFNPEPFDVRVKARSADDPQDGPWQAGWNCFSTKTFSNILEALGVHSHRFHPWTIGIDVPRHEDDPLRSWSFQYLDGSRGIINGTQVMHHFMLLEIHK